MSAPLNMGDAGSILASILSAHVIRDEVKKTLELEEGEALLSLRKLADSYRESAMIPRALGDRLYKAYERNTEIDATVAEHHLQQALEAYKSASTLAPNCVLSLTKYCKELSRFCVTAKDQEQAIELLKQADSIVEPDDPIWNVAVLPDEFEHCKTRKETVRRLCKHLDTTKSVVCFNLFQRLLTQPSHFHRVRVAKLMMECFPSFFPPHHLAPHSHLMLAYELGSSNRRKTLQSTLALADSSVNRFKTSVVMSLFRARVLYLLGRYADAEVECWRGMMISDPRDPRIDEIDVDHAFRAEGHSYSERVTYAKRKLYSLVDRISPKLADYWKTSLSWKKEGQLVELKAAWKVKLELLHFPADALIDYYSESDISAFNSIRSALKFFQANKKWSHIVCPVANCQFACNDASMFMSHLCNKHKQIPFCKLQSVSVLKNRPYGGMGLQQSHYQFLDAREDGAKKLNFWCSGSTQDMFHACPSWLSIGEENSRTKEMNVKQQNNSLLQKMKKKLTDFSTDSSGTEFNKDKLELTHLWEQLIRGCKVDFLEDLVPLIRRFQRMCVLEIMSKDESLCYGIIDAADIKSVFWEDDPKNVPVDYPEDWTFLDYYSPMGSPGCGGNLFSDSIPDADQSVLEPDPVQYVHPKWVPGVIPENLKSHVEISTRLLVVYDDKVPGTGESDVPALYYGSITGLKYSNSSRINCVVTDHKPLEYLQHIFNLLVSCQHPNILKPSGVWVCDEDSCLGRMVFPRIDGAVSEIPGSDLFLEDKKSKITVDFTEQGHHVLRQIFSAVHYVNIHYNPMQAGTALQLFPMQISVGTVYYLKDAVGEYQIFLGWFNTGSPSQEADIDGLIKCNWNAFGSFLETMLNGQCRDKEIVHLLEILKRPSVNYDDLLWEPGLWVVREKMEFIRNVFWSLESDPTKRIELSNKPCLGLQPFAQKLTLTLVEKNLLNSFEFLRNKVLAHQNGPYDRYPGPKDDDVGIRKSTFERFLRREAPEYMLRLISEIRQLNWPLLSPFRRSKADYQKWLQNIAKGNSTSAPGPASAATKTLGPQFPPPQPQLAPPGPQHLHGLLPAGPWHPHRQSQGLLAAGPRHPHGLPSQGLLPAGPWHPHRPPPQGLLPTGPRHPHRPSHGLPPPGPRRPNYTPHPQPQLPSPGVQLTRCPPRPPSTS